jgi:hypothetical protein
MKIQTLNIPCVFQVSGIPANGKHRKYEHQYEMIELQIAVTDSEDEAPVAVHFQNDRILPPYSSVSDEVKLRWFQGNLYEPVVGETYGNGKIQCSLAFLMDFLEKRNFSVPNSHLVRDILGVSDESIMRALDHHNEFRYRKFNERQWKTFETSPRTAAIKKLSSQASDLVVIEGYFWKKCVEPVYELTVSNYDSERSVHLSITPYHGSPEGHRGSIFRLDSWDMAVEAATELGFIPRKTLRATVFIPEAIRCNPLRNILITKVTSALEEEGKRVKDYPVQGMIAYAQLRDEFRQGLKENISADEIAEIAYTYMVSGYASNAAIDVLKKVLSDFDAQAEITVSGPQRKI